MPLAQREQRVWQPEGKVKNLELRVYPNPFSESLLFEFSAPIQKQKLELRIYNKLGQLMEQRQLSGQQQSIQVHTSNWASGMYHYQLFGDTQLLEAGLLQHK